jgi:hypothetical protein
MPKKVRFPKCPESGYIAGWFVGDGESTFLASIEDGTTTSAEAKKLVAWVTQWTKWVEQEEKRVKEGRANDEL